LTITCLVALIPVVFLLVLLAVFGLPPGSRRCSLRVTFALAVASGTLPLDDGGRAYPVRLGDRRVERRLDYVLGLILFKPLSISGVFENFRRWLIAQGSLDVRVQTMLFAWAFGALLRRPGWIRLSVGRSLLRSDFARHLRSSMRFASRHRQQRAGIVRRASARRSSRWPR
jgi:hypothetical protein